LMNCIRFKTGIAVNADVYQSMNEALKQVFNTVEVEGLFKLLDKIYQIKKALMSKVALNKRLQLDDLFCCWAKCFAFK